MKENVAQLFKERKGVSPYGGNGTHVYLFLSNYLYSNIYIRVK